jgi:hypothetical protein
MSIADRIASLSTEWYSKVLREGGWSAADVVEAIAEPMVIGGAAGDLARVRLRYAAGSGAPGPATVIAKTRGSDPMRAAMDAAMGLFAREAGFYATYARELPVAVPRCFHIGDGDATPLLLEDLGALRMGDQLEGVSADDAERLIDVLAALHAKYWTRPPTTLARPGALVSPAEGAYAAMIAQLVQSGAAVVAERFAGQADERVLAALADHAPHWTEVLVACATGPPTLAHNDCRLDHVFFRDDGEPVLIDWQIAASTRGTADIAYLLSGSMQPDLLHGRWEALVRRYHDRLLEGGVRGYSWEQCLEHYRGSVLYGFAPGIAMLGALEATDTRGLGATIVHRVLRHAADVDAFGVLARS